MADEREPEPNRDTVHRAHLVALRAGPFFLGVLGLSLLITAVAATKSDALSITILILGGILSIAAATVTRADELKMTKDGIEAKMSSIAGLDRAGYAVTFRAAEPLPAGKPQIGNSTTVAELIAAGWTFAQTTGTSHATLTKLIRDERPGFVRGPGHGERPNRLFARTSTYARAQDSRSCWLRRSFRSLTDHPVDRVGDWDNAAPIDEADGVVAPVLPLSPSLEGCAHYAVRSLDLRPGASQVPRW